MKIYFYFVFCSLFVLGFGLFLSASNQPFGLLDEEYEDEDGNPIEGSQKELFINATETETTHPAKMVEVLFFALFGITDYEDAEISQFVMPWSSLLIKVTPSVFTNFFYIFKLHLFLGNLRSVFDDDNHRAYQLVDCDDVRHLL